MLLKKIFGVYLFLSLIMVSSCGDDDLNDESINNSLLAKNQQKVTLDAALAMEVSIKVVEMENGFMIIKIA